MMLYCYCVPKLCLDTVVDTAEMVKSGYTERTRCFRRMGLHQQSKEF